MLIHLPILCGILLEWHKISKYYLPNYYYKVVVGCNFILVVAAVTLRDVLTSE